ncbi:MAG: hypothetical protein IKX00_02940 [Bacilli bacterium]|nr:hypothetical protein [Bacilli bacterium]
MESSKEKMHPFFKLLIILFIIFIAFYIALESGYYPSKIRKDTILTSKELNKFEKDVENGVAIKEDGYIKKDEDYSNFVTKAGNALTYSFGKALVSGSKGLKDIFKYLFW